MFLIAGQRGSCSPPVQPAARFRPRCLHLCWHEGQGSRAHVGDDHRHGCTGCLLGKFNRTQVCIDVVIVMLFIKGVSQ